LSNTVFRLKTTRGKYILKVFEVMGVRGGSTKFIRFQIRLTNALAEAGANVAEVYKNKHGERITQYKGKNIAIIEFLEGTNFERTHNMRLIADLTKKVVQMHKVMLKLKFRGGDAREPNHQFKRHKLTAVVDGFSVQDKWDDYLKEARQLDKTKLRRCIIHSDMTTDNFLVDGDKVTAIIDFDDSHWDFLTHDIGVLIYGLFVSSAGIYTKELKYFLRTYQKAIPLNNEEKKAVYYFALARFLGTIKHGWDKRRLHPDKKASIEKWVRGKIKRYNNLRAIPVEEFVTWFD